MTTAREMIQKMLDDGTELSDESVAITVMQELKVHTKASQALVDVVAAAVTVMRRAAVRSIEQAAYSEPRVQSSRKTVGATPIDRVSARKRLLDETFRFGDGSSVRWGDATVADHQRYIDMMLSKRAGIDATVGRHRNAIAEIEAAGVTCLRDIQAAA